MTTRRFLVPAVSAAAVVAIAVGATLVTKGHDGPGRPAPLGSPKLPAFAVNGGPESGAAMAADAPAKGAPRKIGPPVPAGGAQTVTIKGDLPQATDALVTAYRLQRRAATRADLAGLAEALGIKGEPKQTGAGWVVTDGKRTLSIDPTPAGDWHLFPGDTTGCGGGWTSYAPLPGGSGVAPAGSVGGGSGGAGSAGTVQTDPPIPPDAPVVPDVAPAGGSASEMPAPKPMPAIKPLPAIKPAPADRGDDPSLEPNVMPEPRPGPCSTIVGSAVACAPPGAETLVACPTPPAKPLPSADAARTAARELMTKLKTEYVAEDLRVDDGYDGVRHVSIRRRVDGHQADGLVSDVGVDASGAIVTASGQLAEPVAAGEYPMLPPAELAQRIADGRMMTMLCRHQEGVEGCAPPPPLVVTGATAGLSLVQPADYEKGEAFLLPAWLFTIEGDPNPIAVVAIPKQYLSDPAPPDRQMGKPEPDPAPPDPAVDPTPASDLPATTAPAPEAETTSPAHAPAPKPAPNAISLVTSDWTGGQTAMAALLTGKLAGTAHGCLLVVNDGVEYPPSLIWPAGYSAASEGKAETITVRNAQGEVVARTGDRFSAGGGFVSKNPAKCGPGEAFTIQDAGPYND